MERECERGQSLEEELNAMREKQLTMVASHEQVSEWVGSCTGCVSLTTKGSGGTAHTCSGRHNQYSCELLAWVTGVALHVQLVSDSLYYCLSGDITL